MGEENHTQGKSLPDGDGFFWQDYLDATETVEVPQIMFSHVEDTLQNGIEIGMSLEVPVKKIDSKSDNEPIYWVATIVMACGPLLRLRYYGGDDRSLEFWFNLTKEAAHELGWSVKNDKRLEPPNVVLERSPDCSEKLQEFLTTAKSIPFEMLSGDGLSIVDRIKRGMKIEVSDVQHPYKLWVATIKENVGGRLLLQYDTPGSSVNEEEKPKGFWMFCTSEHLYQYGFASKANSNWFLEPPSSIVDTHTYEQWKEITENGPKDLKVPETLFNNCVEHAKHNFKLGMKLEAVSPADQTKLCPATVVKVFDDSYFLVHIDVYNKDSVENADDTRTYNCTDKNTWLCTTEHPYIFPIGWAKRNSIRLTSPENWTSKSEEFEWEDYLAATKAVAADEKLFAVRESASDAGIECGMKLEAVDPKNENVICAAQVSKIIDNLLWIKLDNYSDRVEHIVHMHSLQIFPVGWCESNHYPLEPPKDYIEVCKKIQPDEITPKKNILIDIPLTETRSSSWCPKIYFNYRCYTGQKISKGRLATLPKSVGPGPVVLVMKEVLSLIVSAGYRSPRILKALQCNSELEPGYVLEVVKAKFESNTYKAKVAIITSGDTVAKFCKATCEKIGVCPNLFGPLQVKENDCPDMCHKTSKNKFLAAVGTGKRGKPKGYTSIMVQKQKPWGKRKRRRGRWANRDKEQAEEFERELPFLPMDLAKRIASGLENGYENNQSLSEIGVIMQKSFDKSDIKQELHSSNVSEDSRSSFNDRKSKDSNIDSPSSSSGGKLQTLKSNQNITMTRYSSLKRERDWDTSIESDGSDAEYIKLQKKQRRPKTRKLESNPLFWTVDDVFQYLRKTSDCKELAHKVRQEEIDGLAFLLLNLPSLVEHMKLKTSAAMKLCRHVEQVKVTFFLKHINEDEPEQYHVM